MDKTLNNVKILEVVSSEKLTSPFNNNPTNCSLFPSTTDRIAPENVGQRTAIGGGFGSVGVKERDSWPRMERSASRAAITIAGISSVRVVRIAWNAGTKSEEGKMSSGEYSMRS